MIVGHLLPDGNVVYAAGVIVDPAGVIATAYHVMDKPDAVSRCIATAQGDCYPIVEIVAADKSRDVALIKVAAEGLSASPLSTSDDVGAPLTIISHPGAEFFSVTEGTLRRYQAALLYGVEVEQMLVTADFTDGASGGPIFNRHGEVAGIVSFRRPAGRSDMIKVASPSAALRALSD
ncbi:MAG: trypsin-like peptidase domain-containing protein [Planctomycetales bacterium]|nr:trypsin-like peptidase domain-containing protein [Planctomycetales bacterium]MBN8627528.1 trypsin-like peptidase domain-containing protein [Planctomycetota bacterium]